MKGKRLMLSFGCSGRMCWRTFAPTNGNAHLELSRAISGLSLGLLTLCLLSSGVPAQQLMPEGFPAPIGARVQDDEADKSGTRLQVEWAMPEGAEQVAGLVLEGYRIYAAEAGEALVPVEAVEGADRTEGAVRDLWPGRQYQIQVSAVYLPAGEKWATDLKDPTKVVTPGAVEALSVPVGPYQPTATWYDWAKSNVLAVALLYSMIVLLCFYFARRRDMYIRPIPGLEAVNDAIGRATEMGRPMLFVSGLSGISDIATIAAMLILGHIARRAAAYETPIIVPCNDPLVMTAEREIVHQAYIEAGKPDAYEPQNIYYITDSQFGYTSAVDGIMVREKPAANFFMGYFYAEALILAETGNMTGAIQIAGTDADTQLPFFITACDYTLMGEELYAASAYLSRSPLLMAQLKGQDYGKVLLAAGLLTGVTLATLAVFVPKLQPWFEKLLAWLQI